MPDAEGDAERRVDGARRERTGAAGGAEERIVATGSHQQRSPLTSIKGFVELLQRGRSSTLASAVRSDHPLSTDRLVELVNDLLDVARIEAGQVGSCRAPSTAPRSCEETASLLGPRLRAKRQRLSVEAPPELPPVHADPPGCARSRPTCSRTPTSRRPRAGASRSASEPTAGCSRSRSPTTAPGSTRSRSTGYSTASTAARARRAAAAPVSACPSSSRSSTRTAARSRCIRRPGAAPRSSCACPRRRWSATTPGRRPCVRRGCTWSRRGASRRASWPPDHDGAARRTPDDRARTDGDRAPAGRDRRAPGAARAAGAGDAGQGATARALCRRPARDVQARARACDRAARLLHGDGARAQ